MNDWEARFIDANGNEIGEREALTPTLLPSGKFRLGPPLNPPKEAVSWDLYRNPSLVMENKLP